MLIPKQRVVATIGSCGNFLLKSDEESQCDVLSTGECITCVGQAAQRPERRPRSMSEDRRFNESAQFFSAVGQRQNESTLEIIDTEGSCDDDGDEDSAFEVPMENLPAHVSKEEDFQTNIEMVLPVTREACTTSWCSLSTRQSPVSSDLDYRGIGGEGMSILKRGVQRGNCSTLHRKAWLEVSDDQHRYGKNLRLYYRHWTSLGHPTNNFFDWLDCKGEASDQPLPDLLELPRTKLDSDTVLYIRDPEVTRTYALSIITSPDGRGRILDNDGEPVLTGTEGWIFVLRDKVMYGSRKVTTVTRHSKQRFHHSSFFGGKAVAAAGILVTDNDGFLTHLYPHSGHYRPSEPEIQRVLFYLFSSGVDLGSLEVDMQQIIRVCRNNDVTDENGRKNKMKKMCCLHLRSAAYVANFLSHKARCIELGIFMEIEGRTREMREG